MSEYQYYEFRTVHRQLTPAQRAAVDKLSSHGETTATSFSVNYSYGDFKHQPKEVLAKYFDAFFYIANWGSTELMFRFPKGLVDTRNLEPYCFEGDSFTIDYEIVGDNLILRFDESNDGGYEGWIEGDGSLDGVIDLYDAILEGDYRVLYLAWLRVMQDREESEEDEDWDEEEDGGAGEEMTEPPVPPGLAELSPELNAFAELFSIDEDLIAVAAQKSEPRNAALKSDDTAALALLSKEEMSDFLRRLLEGESALPFKLKQRLQQLQPPTRQAATTSRRTFSQLLAGRQAIKEQRKKAAAAAKAAQRQAAMKALAARGDGAWQEVENFIAQQSSNGYAQAAELLTQLRELAVEQGNPRLFDSRIEQIRTKYSRRSALIRVLKHL